MNVPMGPDSVELMTPPYPAMNVSAWRNALNTYIRNNPGKRVAPYKVLSIYRKLVQ